MVLEKAVTVVFDGEVLRPDAPLDLRIDRRYVVTIQKELPIAAADAWDVLDALTGMVNAPIDWAIEHDHYLYGTPKRESETIE